MAGRAVLGEICIWKKTAGWVVVPWLYQVPAVQHGTRADGLSELHPTGLGSVSVREDLVLTHPCAQCHPTPLIPPASMSQPAAMGREAGWLSKSRVSRGMALPGLGKD